MTIIDTTLYLNGALRLSRHGAGKGGNVLVHVASGTQTVISDMVADMVNDTLTNREASGTDFDGKAWVEQIAMWHGWSAEPK